MNIVLLLFKTWGPICQKSWCFQGPRKLFLYILREEFNGLADTCKCNMIKLAVNKMKWIGLVAKSHTVLFRFWFQFWALGPKSYPNFHEAGPRAGFQPLSMLLLQQLTVKDNI